MKLDELIAANYHPEFPFPESLTKEKEKSGESPENIKSENSTTEINNKIIMQK